MIDSDVAEATFLHVAQARVLAEQAARRANNTLATLLGLAPEDPVAVEGGLEPLPLDGVDTLAQDALVAKLPQVQALEASRRSQHERADYFRRARWPNPTFSVFAQNDETDHVCSASASRFRSSCRSRSARRMPARSTNPWRSPTSSARRATKRDAMRAPS